MKQVTTFDYNGIQHQCAPIGAELHTRCYLPLTYRSRSMAGNACRHLGPTLRLIGGHLVSVFSKNPTTTYKTCCAEDFAGTCVEPRLRTLLRHHAEVSNFTGRPFPDTCGCAFTQPWLYIEHLCMIYVPPQLQSVTLNAPQTTNVQSLLTTRMFTKVIMMLHVLQAFNLQ